jgi:hypothetical protein
MAMPDYNGSCVIEPELCVNVRTCEQERVASGELQCVETD